MGKKIILSVDIRKEIASTFDVSTRFVDYALNFDKKRGQTELAERIRTFALLKGGNMSDSIDFETFFDEKGLMTNMFHSNDVRIEVLMKAGHVRIFHKGEQVKECDIESFEEMKDLQLFAASL